MKFNTFDRDNDLAPINYADDRNGWWHTGCYWCSLTAPYDEYPSVGFGIKRCDPWDNTKFAKYATHNDDPT